MRFEGIQRATRSEPLALFRGIVGSLTRRSTVCSTKL